MTDKRWSSMKESRLKLNKAIDDMDTKEIDKQLMYLSEIEPIPHKIEDSKDFAMKIISNSKGGKRIMSKKRVTLLVAIITLVVTLGTVTFGSGLLKFNFYNNDTTVQVRTDDNISEKEAAELAKDAADSYDKEVPEEMILEGGSDKEYKSIDEAQKATGTNFILPTYIPENFTMDESINVHSTPVDDKHVYITYTSEGEQFIGVTMIIYGNTDGTSVMVTDAVYKDTYKTPKGIEYTILNEDGSKIAMIDKGDYQYALIFMNVDDDTVNKVINSVEF